MADAIDAKLTPPARLHRQTGLGQLDEGRVIQPRFNQRFREIDTNPRPRIVALHIGFQNAETVFASVIFQQACGLVARLLGLRQTQRLDRIAPPALAFHRLCQHHQRIVPHGLVARAQISVDRS